MKSIGNFIFKYIDYKAYMHAWIESRPQKGRGEYRKISQAVGISSTLVSQVFKGDKHLSPEQACELVEHLGLNANESEYFLLLVEYARAGTSKLRTRVRQRITEAQQHHNKVAEVVTKDTDLSDAARATFYSNWLYTAIRNLSALPNQNNIPSLADRLQIPRPQVEKVVAFLLKEGLCTTDAKGALQPGFRRTHTGADSSLVLKHHQNWRLRGFDKMVFPDDQQLFYTAPMSLSKEDAQAFRTELLALIKRLTEMVGDSNSETVRCLNIDWFEF